MGFVKFTETGSSFLQKVSIRNNGQIGLSQGLIKSRGLDNGQWYLVLYYDADRKWVGMQPTMDSAAEGAIKVVLRSAVTRDGKTSVSAQMAGRSFLDRFQIPFRTGTKSFDAEWSEADKMIIIDLNKPRNGKDEDV